MRQEHFDPPTYHENFTISITQGLHAHRRHLIYPAFRIFILQPTIQPCLPCLPRLQVCHKEILSMPILRSQTRDVNIYRSRNDGYINERQKNTNQVFIYELWVIFSFYHSDRQGLYVMITCYNASSIVRIL